MLYTVSQPSMKSSAQSDLRNQLDFLWSTSYHNCPIYKTCLTLRVILQCRPMSIHTHTTQVLLHHIILVFEKALASSRRVVCSFWVYLELMNDIFAFSRSSLSSATSTEEHIKYIHRRMETTSATCQISVQYISTQNTRPCCVLTRQAASYATTSGVSRHLMWVIVSIIEITLYYNLHG